MNLQIRKSNRKQAKMKLAIAGPSGSGKTMSALLLAYGLTSNWSDIAVLDTENGSSDLYSDLGGYNVIPLKSPYTPESYIQAIDLAESSGIKVLVIDSLSHCWEYLLQEHSNMPGNSFTNWGKTTPRQNSLVQRILNSNMHIICTIRKKQDYVLNNKNGKMVPEKVGLKIIQRDGVDYEFTLVFDVNINHQATAAKDRTGLYSDKSAFVISSKTGEEIKAWCESGSSLEIEPKAQDLSQRISESKSIKELLEIYEAHPISRDVLKSEFAAKKRSLTTSNSPVHNTPTESFEDYLERGADND
jgi:hypothetical protein